MIPNLLLAGRSMLVVDPKGENVRVAGEMRADYGPTFVLDPFGVTGTPGASYNPLDRMTADSLDLGEDASTLAAALVIDPPGQAGEAHWNEEAWALIVGLVLFCVVHEDEQRRHLGTVREYLTLPPERFRELLGLMQESRGATGLIARAANRFLGKANREAAGVLSGAQRHTHFLDSPRIVQSLVRSDFRFADLRHQLITVFLVLPPNRMDAYSRWLRLLVSEALQDIARDAEAVSAPETTPETHADSESAQEAAGARQASTAPLTAGQRLPCPLCASGALWSGSTAAHPGPVPARRVRRPWAPGGRRAGDGADGRVRVAALADPPGPEPTPSWPMPGSCRCSGSTTSRQRAG